MDRDDPLAHLLVREKETIRTAMAAILPDNGGIVLDAIKYGEPSLTDCSYLAGQMFAHICMHGPDDIRPLLDDLRNEAWFQLSRIIEVNKGGNER